MRRMPLRLRLKGCWLVLLKEDMKRILQCFLLVASFAAHSGMQEAITAYDANDYRTALREADADAGAGPSRPGPSLGYGGSIIRMHLPQLTPTWE